MRRRPLSEWVPPWANAKAHLGVFLALLILPVLYSLASYLPMLSLALSQVHVYGQPDVVDPGSRMTDFADLVGIQGAVSNFFSRPVFFPFLLMLGGAGVLAVVYRLSFRWGSRSDHLMGRLPDRWELARRSFCLPLVLALVFYGVASALQLGSEGLHALFAGIGFLLGIPIIVAWDRHMKKVNGLRFHIVEIKKACSGM
jgi:hypothetical protein